MAYFGGIKSCQQASVSVFCGVGVTDWEQEGKKKNVF